MGFIVSYHVYRAVIHSHKIAFDAKNGYIKRSKKDRKLKKKETIRPVTPPGYRSVVEPAPVALVVDKFYKEKIACNVLDMAIQFIMLPSFMYLGVYRFVTIEKAKNAYAFTSYMQEILLH